MCQAEYVRKIEAPPDWGIMFESPPKSHDHEESSVYSLVDDFERIKLSNIKAKLDDTQLDAIDLALKNKVVLIQVWLRITGWYFWVVHKILKVFGGLRITYGRKCYNNDQGRKAISLRFADAMLIFLRKSEKSVENIRKLNIGQLCPQPRDQVVPRKTFDGITTGNHDQISNIDCIVHNALSSLIERW